MENFAELKNKIEELGRMDDLLDRLPSVGLTGRYGRFDQIFFERNENGRYGFSTVIRFIGEEKFARILEQFKGLLEAELHSRREEIRAEISTFRVVKDNPD